MSNMMDAFDGMAVARLFHHLGDLFAEIAVSDDPTVAEKLAQQAVDAIRTIDELLGDEDSNLVLATRERARWQ